MTTIVARSDLYNPREYGRISAGEIFTVRDSLAADLIRQGLASNFDQEIPPALIALKLAVEAAGQQTKDLAPKKRHRRASRSIVNQERESENVYPR